MLTEQQKKKYWAPKPCLCDTAYCGKCLGVNCTDDECMIHAKRAKLTHRARIAEDYRKADESPRTAEMLELYEFEVDRLRSLLGH